MTAGQLWGALAPWQRRELLASLWIFPLIAIVTLGFAGATP